jgi:hypothetical protein
MSRRDLPEVPTLQAKQGTQILCQDLALSMPSINMAVMVDAKVNGLLQPPPGLVVQLWWQAL